MHGFVLYTLALAVRALARGRLDIADMYYRQAHEALETMR